MRCLVTGGGGFIGSALVAKLAAMGHVVRVLEHPAKEIPGELGDLAQIEWIADDFVSCSRLDSLISGCEVVFHLISTTVPSSSNANPVFDISSNLAPTVALLEAAQKQRIRKFVFASSGGTVYGVPTQIPLSEAHATDPICSYGIVKLAIEKYVQMFGVLYGLQHSILRLANPYGVGQRNNLIQGAIGVFVSRAISNQPLEIWGDGSITRDYVHIDDVVDAMLAAMSYKGKFSIFNIGSGEGVSISRLINAIETAIDRPIDRRFSSARSFDVPVNVLDVQLARKELGWAPRISLEEGIRRMVAEVLPQSR